MSSSPGTRTSTRRRRTSRRWWRSSRRRRSRSKASSLSRTRKTAASRCSGPATTSAARGWAGGVASGSRWALFAPPLLASVAVGAVAGRVMGRFAGNKVNKELHEKIGENLPPGSAGIIAIFDDGQRVGVEQALSGALLRSVVQGDKQGMGALKESLAEAMGKFSPDRTVLPIPDPNFGGTIGRTLDTSVADWTIAMTPSPPEGAPNVLGRADRRRGLRQPVDVRRARLDPDDDAGRRAGPQVQRLPRRRDCARPPAPPC